MRSWNSCGFVFFEGDSAGYCESGRTRYCESGNVCCYCYKTLKETEGS